MVRGNSREEIDYIFFLFFISLSRPSGLRFLFHFLFGGFDLSPSRKKSRARNHATIHLAALLVARCCAVPQGKQQHLTLRLDYGSHCRGERRGHDDKEAAEEPRSCRIG